MERFQQSIEIGVPAHAIYQRLTQFEEYPRFMNSIDEVRRIDSRHLHWRGNRPDPDTEWDSEIVEQIQDRCIAWHNLDGPPNDGRVDLEPLASDRTNLIMTMECDPLEFSVMREGDMREVLAERIRQDLARIKAYIEECEAESHERSGTRQMDQNMQSEYSLSHPSNQEEDDGRFDIAEEVNFDEQSDRARQIGRMPDGFPRAKR